MKAVESCLRIKLVSNLTCGGIVTKIHYFITIITIIKSSSSSYCDHWVTWVFPSLLPSLHIMFSSRLHPMSSQSWSMHIFARVCPRGVMVKAMDCGIEVSEIELHLHNYVHFWTNTLGKGINPRILPAMG